MSKEFAAHAEYYEFLAYYALPKALDRAAGEDAAFKLIVDAIGEGTEKFMEKIIQKGLEAGYVKKEDISTKASSLEHVIEYTLRLQYSIIRGSSEARVSVEKRGEDELILHIPDPFPRGLVYNEMLASAVVLGMLRGLLKATTGLPVFVVRKKQIVSNPNLWKQILSGKPGIVLYVEKLPSEAGELQIAARFIKPS